MTAYSSGFRSLNVEHEGLNLKVEGEIPDWLSGSLIRNGPAKFEVGDNRVNHWFDGLAMLHKFRFADGDVTYSNRFLRTRTFRKAVEEGTLANQFATSGSYLKRLRSFFRQPTDNANVHVTTLGGEYVALTETPRRVRIDPRTLSVQGHLHYDDDLNGHHVTAHPQHDHRRDETVGYMTEFGRLNQYHIYRIPDDRPERILITSINVDRPAYLHSFALTPAYVVIIESPYVVNPLRFLLPGGGGFINQFRWCPERGTRCLVVKRTSGKLVSTLRTTPFFFFHTVNAFESDDAVVIDLITYDDATIIENLFLASLDRQPTDIDASQDRKLPAGAAEGVLTRVHIPLDGSDDIRRQSLYEGIELPRITPATRMHSHRYVYGQATGQEGRTGLVKVDIEAISSRKWHEEGSYAGEPVFVADPESGSTLADEDRGVVLALVLDAETERSLVLVLDGETFAERARAYLPHHVPFGFHGDFFPEITV